MYVPRQAAVKQMDFHNPVSVHHGGEGYVSDGAVCLFILVVDIRESQDGIWRYEMYTADTIKLVGIYNDEYEKAYGTIRNVTDRKSVV